MTSVPSYYSFQRKYGPARDRMATETSESRAFGAEIDVNAPPQQKAKAGLDDVFATPAAQRAPQQQAAEDPASSGKRLAKRLGEVAKSLATPVEHKPRSSGRRCSVLDEHELHTSILDLSGFDAQGERRRHSLSTPLIVNGKGRVAVAAGLRLAGPETSAGAAELADLRSQRDEMMSILEGYQGTIQKMMDEHSADACAWTSENKLLKTEVERLRQERQQIHQQFTLLYDTKYVPLKEHAKNLELAVAEVSRESATEAALREELRLATDRYEQVVHERERALVKVAEKQQYINELESRMMVAEKEVEKFKNLQRKLSEMSMGFTG